MRIFSSNSNVNLGTFSCGEIILDCVRDTNSVILLLVCKLTVKGVRCKGAFTPSENETDTDTDNKYTEPNGNLCCHWSLALWTILDNLIQPIFCLSQNWSGCRQCEHTIALTCGCGFLLRSVTMVTSSVCTHTIRLTCCCVFLLVSVTMVTSSVSGIAMVSRLAEIKYARR